MIEKVPINMETGQDNQDVTADDVRKVSNEAIHYQADNPADEIAKRIREIREQMRESDYPYKKWIQDGMTVDVNEIGTLLGYIKKRFNVTIKLRISPDLAAYYSSPFYDLNSVLEKVNFEIGFFNTPSFDICLQNMRNNLANNMGYIDLKNAKLGGQFTKVSHSITMGSLILLSDEYCSEEEAAALLLHEIGHIFTSYEWLANTLTTNAAIKMAVNDILSNEDPVKKIKLLAFLEKEQFIGKIPDKDEFIQLDKEGIANVLVAETIAKMRDETSERVQHNFSEEFSADQFMMRCGGKMTTMTEKLIEHQNSRFYGVSSIGMMSGLLAAVSFTTSFFVLGLIPLFAVGFSFFNVRNKLEKFNDNVDLVYGNVSDRITRMRHEAIGRLKKDPKNKDNAELIKSIDIALVHLKKIKEPFNLNKTIRDFIFSYARASRDLKKKEQLLESLLHNELFVQGGKFAQLIQPKGK